MVTNLDFNNTKENLLSIVFPFYNEEKTILKALKRLNDLNLDNFDFEIIAVNDGSTDNSLNILKENQNLYTELISYSSNRGKGYAVKKALEKCLGNYVIFQDADLEYNPKDIEEFIRLINQIQNVDVIIGSRLNYKNYSRSHNFYNKVGNIILTTFFNFLYFTTFTDIYSCYLCFKKNLISVDKIKTVGFEQHAEILCQVISKGKKFYEVPINYDGRGYDEGKKIRFYHIFSVLLEIIKGKFKN